MKVCVPLRQYACRAPRSFGMARSLAWHLTVEEFAIRQDWSQVKTILAHVSCMLLRSRQTFPQGSSLRQAPVTEAHLQPGIVTFSLAAAHDRRGEYRRAAAFRTCRTSNYLLRHTLVLPATRWPGELLFCGRVGSFHTKDAA